MNSWLRASRATASISAGDQLPPDEREERAREEGGDAQGARPVAADFGLSGWCVGHEPQGLRPSICSQSGPVVMRQPVSSEVCASFAAS